jgi:hypothetical protein
MLAWALALCCATPPTAESVIAGWKLPETGYYIESVFVYSPGQPEVPPGTMIQQWFGKSGVKIAAQTIVPGVGFNVEYVDFDDGTRLQSFKGGSGIVRIEPSRISGPHFLGNEEVVSPIGSARVLRATLRSGTDIGVEELDAAIVLRVKNRRFVTDKATGELRESLSGSPDQLPRVAVSYQDWKPVSSERPDFRLPRRVIRTFTRRDGVVLEYHHDVTIRPLAPSEEPGPTPILPTMTVIDERPGAATAGASTPGASTSAASPAAPNAQPGSTSAAPGQPAPTATAGLGREVAPRTGFWSAWSIATISSLALLTAGGGWFAWRRLRA